MSLAKEPSDSLVGDYRFGPEDLLANEVPGGLPNLLREYPPDQPPVLTGQEIPTGGDGAAGNGWAMAWTVQIQMAHLEEEGRCMQCDLRIPPDPQLQLGERFTLWMRILYGGEARGSKPHNLLTLENKGGLPVLAWTLTSGEEMALELSLAGPEGNVQTFRAESDSGQLLPQISRWYDLAVSFDGGTVTLAATPLGRPGPGQTRSQAVKLCEGRSLAPAEGPMRVLKATNTALERLRIYRGEALSAEQIGALSRGVRIPGPEPTRRVEVGVRRQLFLDDAVVARMRGLQRVLHPVTKHPENPIIRKEQPVDGRHGPCFWGSVIYDEDEEIFKLWGQALTLQQPEVLNHLYFTSLDGIRWTRPELNILGPDNCFDPPRYPHGHGGVWLTLRKDRQATDPQKRYRGFIQRDPLYYLTSPDGLHWEVEGVAAHFTDDTTTAVYHPAREEYVKIGRFCPDGRSMALRLIMTCTSDRPQAEGNTPWHLVMLPDERDLAAHEDMQFYHMPAFPYGDLYLGILGVYYSGPEDGSSDHELTMSRDGLNWRRICPGEKFIERGAPGSWDSGFSGIPGTGPIRRGDELWFYYGCMRDGHHRIGETAIGLAKLRVDGFVSLRAGRQEGALQTRPFVLEGDALMINAQAFGEVQVRVVESDTGAELAVSNPFTGDAVDHVLVWSNGERLGAHRGRRVHLEFTVRDADLYAFEVADLRPATQTS